jgi:hypothetical protein
VPATELSPRVVETNVTVEQLNHTVMRGYSDSPEAYAVIADADRHHRLIGTVTSLPEPLTLDGDWEFVAEDANALVIGRWMATPEVPGASPETYMAPQVDTRGWQPMVPGAWSYQLPSEPDRPYPIDVWYRVEFAVNEVPSRLDLIVDGFAGSGWSLYVNGLPATSKPVRSPIDSQMQSIDVTNSIQQGSNVIALRLTLTSATDGLLDLIKLMGPFSLDRQDGQDRIAAPRSTLRPVSWTGQGYPYYSGRGLYRRRITLPDAFTGFRTFVEPAMIDDVLELVVNGRTAGVRLWPPYELEITELLKPGENTVELRVANTLVNLLEATERPSGLAGPPRVVARADVLLSLPVAAEVGSSSPGGE